MKNKRIIIKENPSHDQQHQALLGRYEENDMPKNIKTISIVLSTILIVRKKELILIIYFGMLLSNLQISEKSESHFHLFIF